MSLRSLATLDNWDVAIETARAFEETHLIKLPTSGTASFDGFAFYEESNTPERRFNDNVEFAAVGNVAATVDFAN